MYGMTSNMIISEVMDNRGVHYDVPFPVDSGVNVFAVNKDGETALQLVASREPSYRAASGHNEGLFRALMAKGVGSPG